ncbi:MAG: hypothetical protein JNJ60_13210 [Rhodocyclaceae bacterium]|nr:hypothetical protein [Rhodocyclaceae bacterium]
MAARKSSSTRFGPRCPSRAGRGYTYLLLLFAVAVMAVAMAAAAQVWATNAQRSREQELLFIGGEFSRALQSYFDASPGEARRYPARLEDLLEDRRKSVLLRHLRKIYVDPVTRKAEWGTVVRDGQVVGVYSLARGQPLSAMLPEYVSVEALQGVVSDDGRSITLPPASGAGPQTPGAAPGARAPAPAVGLAVAQAGAQAAAPASGRNAAGSARQVKDYREWVFVPVVPLRPTELGVSGAPARGSNPVDGRGFGAPQGNQLPAGQ